jgi:hypothetical protein
LQQNKISYLFFFFGKKENVCGKERGDTRGKEEKKEQEHMDLTKMGRKTSQ